ncbi:MAG: hypothetical protein K0B81_07780 [Candidatus Cloacimonetes bacterium]|nr:hypothetical protein [Candidatus Cloacimonadota bacterium]
MRSYLIALLLVLPIFLYSGQTSIYDIQYTNNSGTDGTYPSAYRNQIVTTSGIVTATGYRNGGFFISEPEGGPWRGIYINDRSREVRLGDLVELTGEVTEQFGFTTIRNVRQLKVISSNNSLPAPALVTTGELAVSEAYEGVLVQLANVSVSGYGNQNEVWLINDGSGLSRLGTGFINNVNTGLNISTGHSYSRVIGVVDYRFGEYRINPRNGNDLLSSPVGVNRPSWGRIKSYYR